MKPFYLFLLFFFLLFGGYPVFAQNISINVLTQNTGVVTQGGTVFLEVTVCNTDPTLVAPTNKVRPQISVPSALVSIPATGHQLPPGWSIVSNTGAVIRVCNGTDPIPTNTCRTILIAMQGNTQGGPQTVSGQLTFANGTNCGVSGPATPSDLPADNNSTSTVTVSGGLPVKLSAFDAVANDCKVLLRWTTETEENSDRFDVEKFDERNNQWLRVASVPAKGNSNHKNDYQYSDQNPNPNQQTLYRLKMVDRDRSFEYSPTVFAKVDCNTVLLNVHPNPVQGGQLLATFNGTSGSARAQLVSAVGQIVLSTTFRNGLNTVDVSGITNGLYVLTVDDAGGRRVQANVILKR